MSIYLGEIQCILIEETEEWMDYDCMGNQHDKIRIALFNSTFTELNLCGVEAYG